MKILMVGDLVGSAGRTWFCNVATRMKARGEVDVIVVNAENSAGFRGTTPSICEDLFEAGADAITLGDHTWDQRELPPYLDTETRIVRPANFSPSSPGRGITTIETEVGPLTIMNLIGRVFLNPNDCPFRGADRLLASLPKDSGPILLDFHAEATSEKVAMGWYLDGRVSAVVGTHTHVQTSDARVLPKGTAYLTDLGMTGSKDSVIGCKREAVLHRFLTGLPARFESAGDNVALEGALIDIDPSTRKARSIESIRVFEDS